MVFILKGFREEYGIEVSALGIFYLANVSFLFYFFFACTDGVCCALSRLKGFHSNQYTIKTICVLSGLRIL